MQQIGVIARNGFLTVYNALYLGEVTKKLTALYVAIGCVAAKALSGLSSAVFDNPSVWMGYKVSVAFYSIGILCACITVFTFWKNIDSMIKSVPQEQSVISPPLGTLLHNSSISP